jgi:class 3 adenylate cyclase/HAMP domain-containing protein
MIRDFLVKFFQGVLGETMFYRLTASPTDLVEVDSSFLKISTTGVPIRLSGVIRALMLVMWSEFNEAESYLDFLIENKAERPDNFDFAAVRKGSFHAHYRSTSPITPAAWDLIEKTRRVGIQLTSREQVTTEERMLIKTRPGQSLAMYILTGTTSLKSIFEEQISLERGVNALLLLGLLLLGLLVISLYWYFMSPLKQLQSGLDQIGRGDFQARIAVNSRNDEFGNIGRSFNAMAKGLEEGSLLGKFVSSAVINVVKNKSAFEKAMVGEKREMTILFASIKTSSDSAAEAFIEQLAFHLKSCQEVVRQTAGVIDKVMETKILVFFDHEACKGADHAVKQAVETVSALKRKLAENDSNGYYGLATGSVVAGILGAKNIRLDYTVIGDAVNLSARLNALAENDSGSKIIIDGKTRQLLSDRDSAESLGEISIKGKTAPVPIYRVLMRAEP